MYKNFISLAKLNENWNGRTKIDKYGNIVASSVCNGFNGFVKINCGGFVHYIIQIIFSEDEGKPNLIETVMRFDTVTV